MLFCRRHTLDHRHFWGALVSQKNKEGSGETVPPCQSALSLEAGDWQASLLPSLSVLVLSMNA